MIAAPRFVSSLTSSATKPSRVVGLCFDDTEITAIELHRQRGSQPVFVRAGRIPLPAAVVDEGEIVDADAFAAALRELWGAERFETKNVVVGLDGRTTVIRQAELPVLDPAELAQAAAYQMGELLSFPLDEAVVSTLEIGRLGQPDGSELVRTITMAVHQDGLLTIHDAVKQAGLRLVTTEVVAAALASAAGELAKNGLESGSDAGGLDLVVHVSSTATLVAVRNEQGLAFSRVITAGVEAGASSLSDELEMELAMLASYADGEEGPSAPRPQQSTSGIATVVEGVRRTAQYYRDEIDRRPIDRLLLCGPQSEAGGLANALAESMPDADILRLRLPGANDEIDEPAVYDAAGSIALVASIGVAGNRRFDLTPRLVRERRAARRRIAVGVAAVALLAPLLLTDAMVRRDAIADERAQTEATELAVEALRTELATFEPALLLERDAERATDRVNGLRRLDLGFESLVRQVAESMPEDTFLISLSIGRANAGEGPTGFTGDPPPATLALTGVAGDLDGVGRWLETVDEVPAVGGLWMTQSAVGPYGATDRIATVFSVDGAVTGPGEPVPLLGELDSRAAAGEERE